MGRVLVYLIRFALILTGYVAAALAASLFIHLLFLGSVGFLEEDMRPATSTAMLFSVPFLALFVAYFAFIPAIVAIVVSEWLGRKDWLVYAVLGGAVAVGFIGMASGDAYFDIDFTATPIVLGLVGSGIVGGIAYWLIAGRSAGIWRSLPPADLPISPGPSES